MELLYLEGVGWKLISTTYQMQTQRQGKKQKPGSPGVLPSQPPGLKMGPVLSSSQKTLSAFDKPCKASLAKNPLNTQYPMVRERCESSVPMAARETHRTFRKQTRMHAFSVLNAFSMHRLPRGHQEEWARPTGLMWESRYKKWKQ